ncbi:dienelactone hydrolase family protein [Peribacillus sp. NPDC096448]|uniref:dienelactone hydrolase family protein n=1 Tax=Peribacillus sp. NPDC096448 TaxID=3364395 RepID=UPI00381D5568
MEDRRDRIAILVIHEIYGLNAHIKDICANLKQLNYTVISPNLLEKVEYYTYKEENKAYLHFVKEIGFEVAAEKVKVLARKLRSEFSELYILGFSVGATIAWLCSNEFNLFNGAIGFYGSRIRDYLSVTPKCKTLLFFPEKEKSFDPNEIIKELEEKNSTQVIKVSSKHGFMDKLTSNYNENDFKLCFKIMNEFILEQSNKKDQIYFKHGEI